MCSRLCTEANLTWRVGKLLSVTGDPDSWEGLQKSRPISKKKTVGGILSVIRNALAHGNIWTLRDPIEAIIFVKRVSTDDKVVRHFDFLSVSPHEFQHFLEGWFDFLISLRISQEAAFGIFKDAA